MESQPQNAELSRLYYILNGMYFLGDFMIGYVSLKTYMGENFQDYS